MVLRICLVVLIILSDLYIIKAQDKSESFDLTVLENPAQSMMQDYLTAIIDSLFAERDSLLATFKTADDWQQRAQVIKDSMISWTGPFPERNPLNPQITGTIERHDYIMEKILFESRPDFLVSGNLYLPKKRQGRLPAVLNVIGHSATGKASVQQRCIGQAKKGMVAFVIDAIGQGERQVSEYAEYGSAPGNAHRIIGTKAFLCGTHVFNYMVWDAIRAVDYLFSRPEVDTTQIAITGCSGGGMMSTYILPFEPRITVAVPACNPNTWSHRVHANLPSDHEQVFFGCFKDGIDPRGDPLFTHVPKPLLINATTDDRLNPPRGVWNLSTWLFKAYSTFNAPHKFQTTMVHAPHGYNLEQREFAYSWMLYWLGGDAANFWEGDLPVEAEQDLWCTASGSVYNEKNSKQPHDLVVEYFNETEKSGRKDNPDSPQDGHQIKSQIQKILCIERDVQLPETETRPARLAGDIILKPQIIKPESGILLPCIWIEPGHIKKQTGAVEKMPQEHDLKAVERNNSVVIYLHDEGKQTLLQEKELLDLMLKQGSRILAVDFRGSGETAPGLESKFWDFLAGKPLFGQRVNDVRSILKWVTESENNTDGITIWANGLSGLYSAFALSLDGDVDGLIVENSLVSFENLITTMVPVYKNEIILPGILKHFDLPQIYMNLCPMKITMIDPLLGDKSLASKKQSDMIYRKVSDTYQNLKKSQNWSVHNDVTDQKRIDLILSAIEH